MSGGSGGGGKGGRTNGGGSGDAGQPGEVVRAANEAQLGARMDAASNRLYKKITALDKQQRELSDAAYNARTDNKRARLEREAEAIGIKKAALAKQRTKIYKKNPLTAKREAERLNYAMTR